MPAIAAMADLGRSAAAGGMSGSVAAAGAGPGPGVLGDYQLVREIGRGGMGIVYEAEQLSLHRRVALKILPLAAAMDSRQMQRFQLEAQAAACLHHTNIVPVHAIGCERGVPFYVMQYIEGRSLAQVIDELRRLEGLDAVEELGANLGDISKSTRRADSITRRSADDARRPSERHAIGSQTVRPVWSGEAGCELRHPVASTSPPRRTARPTVSSTRSRGYIRTVTQFGVQVAEGLDHAHTRGILHRDIKPGNLLLDDQGQLWVTDFGLAQIPGNPGLTLTGDVLGTLRYMSPEQALAKRVVIDGRTDLYSLAVTLYELLTLRPAIDGQERQEILRKIAEVEPAPPRKLNPAVPHDLETILLKAMAKEPSGRYATAKELADELRRFLEDKPIRAQRPSLLSRLAKLSRRHRAAVWSVGVSVAVLSLMAVGGLVTSNFLITRERNQKDAALKQRETALAAAETNLLLARQAVDELYTRVADEIAGQPHMQLFQRDVLEKALRFYQQFAQRKSGDPAIQRETAAALLRVGRIQHTLGRDRLGRQACEATIAALENLSAALPTDPERLVLLADGYSLYGELLAAQGRRAHAEKAERRAIALWGDLLAERPDVLRYRFSLAAGHEVLAAVLSNRPREAENALREAIRLFDEVVLERSDQAQNRFALCGSYCKLGRFLASIGRYPEAESAIRQATTLFDSSSRLPDRPDWHWQRADVECELGNVLRERGRWEDAEKAYRKAVAEAQGLISLFPHVPGYRQSLALHSGYLASSLAALGRRDESAALRKSARDLCEKLEEEFEEVPDRLHHLGVAYKHFATVGDSENAERFLRKALALAGELTEESAFEPAHRESVAETSCLLAVAMQRRGRLREAIEHFRQAVLTCERLVEEFPDDSNHRYLLARHLNYLGSALRYLPEEAAIAVRCHQKSIALCERLVAEFPDQPDYRRELVRSRFGLGIVLRITGRLTQAVQSFRQAQQDYRPYADKTDEPNNRLQFASISNELAWLRATCRDTRYRDPSAAVTSARKAVELAPEKGEFWNTLGVALIRVKDWTEARAALAKSTSLRKGGDSFDWFFLATTDWQLGNRDQARKWYDRAVEWMERSRPKDEELNRFRAEAEELLQISATAPSQTSGPR
jgi:serine/threonine protein kinase